MMNVALIQKQVNLYLEYERNQYFIDLTHQIKNDGNISLMQEYFLNTLAFGTGGLRGLIQPGFSCINPVTIQLASQGLADYAISYFQKPITAIISYDTRLFSEQFASIAACTLATAGVHVYMFSKPTPVAILSYAIRIKKANLGIMITASHNPKEYNGYKVYWDSGEQITSPHDKSIENKIKQTKPRDILSKEEAFTQKLVHWLDDSIIDNYQKEMFALPIIDTARKKNQDTITSSVCYTPLHGSGYETVTDMLEKAGFTVFTPKEQTVFDGNFSTVLTPNPEDPENLKIAIDLAKKEKASLVLATDPDADRLGVAVLHNEQFTPISGNQIGILLIHFIMETFKSNQALKSNLLFVNTVVTSPLQNIIAQKYGIQEQRVLTGFKHIAQVISQTEKNNLNTYILGCEESYGYLIHTLSRDKDAVSAALLIALIHQYYAHKKQTLIDVLQSIYQNYGYYVDHQVSYTLPGLEGVETIKHIMKFFISTPPRWWGTSELLRLLDYQHQKIYNYLNKTSEIKTLLPKTNLIQFELKDNTLISVRPSGTEPKIKIYISTYAEDEKTATDKITLLSNIVDSIIQPYL